MKTLFPPFALIVLLTVFLSGGCGKNPASAPVALPEEEIPAAVTKAFKDTNKEVQDGVGRYVSAIKGHDLPTAFEELQDLVHLRGLTDEQRSILAQASRTTTQKLQDAAASGDAGAAEVLKTFRSSK